MFLCVITTKTVYCICPLPAPVALVVCGAKASCKVILLCITKNAKSAFQHVVMLTIRHCSVRSVNFFALVIVQTYLHTRLSCIDFF